MNQVEMEKILKKVDQNEQLGLNEAVELLSVDTHSDLFYTLISKANALSRTEYGEKGYIFAQIGLNCAPCSGNCKFCSLGVDNYAIGVETEKEVDEVLREVEHVVEKKADALFLMTTADYSMDAYLQLAAKVKELLPEEMMFIANVGDFGKDTAKRLKQVGFTGVYHIVRLGEGEDTDLPVEQRVKTLDAIRDVGLDLIYCVEPIGPEHTYEQIATEMIRARDYHVDVMACMRRVAVCGTPLEERGEISELELTKIVAVTRLVTRPKKSMNVHEPMAMPLMAGVNQLYAEIGINPRDCETETQKNRGFTIERAAQMLKEADYIANAL